MLLCAGAPLAKEPNQGCQRCLIAQAARRGAAHRCRQHTPRMCCTLSQPLLCAILQETWYHTMHVGCTCCATRHVESSHQTCNSNKTSGQGRRTAPNPAPGSSYCFTQLQDKVCIPGSANAPTVHPRKPTAQHKTAQHSTAQHKHMGTQQHKTGHRQQSDGWGLACG